MKNEINITDWVKSPNMQWNSFIYAFEDRMEHPCIDHPTSTGESYLHLTKLNFEEILLKH